MASISSANSSYTPNVGSPANVNYNKIEGRISNEMRKSEGAYLERRDDLLLQLHYSSDPGEKMKIAREIQKLDSIFKEYMEKAPENKRLRDKAWNSASGKNNEFLAHTAAFSQVIRDSWTEFGVADPSSASATCNKEGQGVVGHLPTIVSPPQHTVSTSGGSSAASDPFSNYNTMTPAEVMRAMNENPEGFWEDLSAMSMEERGQLQMKLQMHLQQVNQMLTMLSQMQQSLHDTAKTMIGNMRV